MKTNKLQLLLPAILVIIALVFTMNGFAGAAASTPVSTVGYVDQEKLQTGIDDYKAFQTLLKDKQSEFNLFKSYLFQKQSSELKSLEDKDKQEKQGKSADEQAAIDKKYRDIAQKQTDGVTAQLEQKQAEITKALNAQKKTLDEKIRKLIADVAADKKLTMVLDKNVLFYGGTDISDAVIEKAKKSK